MAISIRQLTAQSHLMRTIASQMQAYRNGYEGGPAFKNMTLVKRPSEDAALFREKLNNVAVIPICKAIVDEIVDVIYEEEPTRHPAFLTRYMTDAGIPDWYLSFLDDADLTDNTFSAVMEQAATMAGIEGWSWIFIDLPEDPSPDNRPYLSVCSAEHVIDWKIYTEYGKNYLEFLKVIEYQDADCTIYRLWYAGDAANPTICERYIIKEEHMMNQENLVEPAEVYTLPMGIGIPAVQCIARQDQRRSDLGVSDLQEAVDVQREMFKLECEAFDSIRFSKPMIRAAAGIRIPAGGGGIIRGDKDTVEVFAIPTQDIAEIRAQQQSLIERLDAFTGRGSLRTTTMKSQSGIAIVEERRALHRKASQRARRLEAVEEQVLSIAAEFMDLHWVGEVQYSKDYEDKDLQFRMALLETAQKLSINNPVVQRIIDTEVIKLIAPPDKTAEYLAMIGASEAEQPANASDWLADSKSQADMREDIESDQIFDSEIQDKGVTTNDPLARQLIMIGVGR
jgi:hypothetical protein